MSLPYKRKRSSRPAKRPRKRPIEPRRVPEIYVQVERPFGNMLAGGFAKAHIRVRRGCYRFLVWRDGGKVCEFYLGRLRNPSPTDPSGARRQVRDVGEACRSSRRRRVRK